MEKKGKEAKAKVLWKLFISTLYLSAFTFGGGYVIVTLMKKKFVDDLHWIDEKEMLDLVAIAQSSPGAIAVNGAIVVGYKLAGIAGVLVSILETIQRSELAADYADSATGKPAYNQKIFLVVQLKGL